MNTGSFDAALSQRTERLVGRCGGAINELISERILGGPGRPAGDYARRLAERGRLVIHSRVLPGGRNLITLARKAARDHGLPEDRAVMPRENALDDLVARLVFCYLSLDQKRRYPLEPGEAASLLGAKLPNNVAHVLTDESGEPMLLRLYRCTSSTPARVVTTLRSYIADAARKWRTWLTDGDYGFAVLCPTDAARRSVDAAVRRSALLDEARIFVFEAPDGEHLNSYLRRRKKLLRGQAQ